MIKFSNVFQNNILGNIPFLISSFAAIVLYCMANLNYKGMLVAVLTVLCASLFLKLDFDFIKDKKSPYKMILSAIVTAYLAYVFFTNLIKSNQLHTIANSLHISAQTVLLFITVGLSIISFYAIYYTLCIILYKFDLLLESKNIYKNLSEYKNFKISFIALLLIFLVSNVAIIRANYNYIDDMNRKMNGISDWGFGRVISNILSKFIHADTYLTDISPLTTIIAVFFLTLASLIVITTYANDKKITAWNIIAVIPLGVSPLFLECMSYKFDCPYMALSILTSVAPLLFINKRKALYFESIIIFNTITCSTYQASLGIFPVAIILLSLLKWLKGERIKDILKVIGFSAAGYVVSIFLFRLYILSTTINPYASTEIIPLKELFPRTLNNIKELICFIKDNFDIKWIIFMFIIALTFVVLSVFHSKRNKIASIVLVLFGLLLSFVLCMGVYIVLDSFFFACRTVYGFTAVVSLLAVVCTTYEFSKIAKLSCLCLSWCFISFAFTYGNVLVEQQRYVDFRISMVLNELDETIDVNDNEKYNIQISGNCGYSPAVANIPEIDGVLGKLVRISFGEDSIESWQSYYFYNYFDLHNYNKATNLESSNLPIVSDNYYQVIRSDGKNILIELKDFSENK